MNSLKNIIQELEDIIKEPNENDYEHQGYWLAHDSLYWLKQYRDTREDLSNKIEVLRQALDVVKYPDPLPWEFFPLRKGKPVWIKFMGAYNNLSRWAIITRIEKDKLCFTASDGVDGYNGHLYKRDMGIEWEVYTKEVKNEDI